jgi:uridylate kinase
MTSPAKFKRILLKLSGEVLMGNQQFGIDTDFVAALAAEVKAAKETGLEICLVIGGATSFAAWPARPRAWTGPRPITWACSPR